MSVADTVAALEEQLAKALSRVEQLENGVMPYSQGEWFEMELESVLDAIQDYRRELITIDELYERTIGR